MPGFTDNADHDDAIILVTSGVGVMATVLAVDVRAIACVMVPVVLAPELPPSTRVHAVPSSRATFRLTAAA